MDTKATGALIAQRRRKLALSQVEPLGDRTGHARSGQSGVLGGGAGTIHQRTAEREGTNAEGTAESGGRTDYGEHEAGESLEVAGVGRHGGGTSCSRTAAVP